MAVVPGSQRSHRPVGCCNHRSGLLHDFSSARPRSRSPRTTASSQHSARRLRCIPRHCLWGDRSRCRPFCDRLRLSCGLRYWRLLRSGRAHHGGHGCMRCAGVANHTIRHHVDAQRRTPKLRIVRSRYAVADGAQAITSLQGRKATCLLSRSHHLARRQVHTNSNSVTCAELPSLRSSGRSRPRYWRFRRRSPCSSRQHLLPPRLRR